MVLKLREFTTAAWVRDHQSTDNDLFGSGYRVASGP